MFKYCVLISFYIIMMAIFAYRVIMNYKNFCKESNFTTTLLYLLSVVAYSLFNGWLLCSTVEIFHKVWNML